MNKGETGVAGYPQRETEQRHACATCLRRDGRGGRPAPLAATIKSESERGSAASRRNRRLHRFPPTPPILNSPHRGEPVRGAAQNPSPKPARWPRRSGRALGPGPPRGTEQGLRRLNRRRLLPVAPARCAASREFRLCNKLPPVRAAVGSTTDRLPRRSSRRGSRSSRGTTLTTRTAGSSMDQFKGLREMGEEAGRKAAAEVAGDEFQVVVDGKKDQGPSGQDGGAGGSDAVLGAAPARITAKDKVPAVAPGMKAKVTFHDPSIPRPQELYSIRVNNYNLPFNHVWLERSEDGTRPVHPLEKLPVEQFIDRNIPESEPVRPADVEDTPFTLVEDLKGLAELSKKLKDVNEFAVDLEHNQYRSFQGMTCLMQISTRTEDFIVDTLKLRIYIGLYFQELFKDPTKRKVMHGADRDIMWLQRDFHLYVCNLFDTGQASRVLQMERNSLEHLLQHFCGVTANKAYQNADWRSRPLPDEMIKYAREDTHYLLYIYDLMRLRLQKESTCENDLLLEVQKRSNEICLQLYEKELLTDTSYLHIYGLQEHELDADQLAVVSALHQWRDYVARQEDESTGYVLPNKALIEIAKKMPTTTADLRRIVKSKYPFVEANFDQILDLIWNATENSDAFEAIAEQLKKVRLDQLDLKSILATGEIIEMAPLDADNIAVNFDPTDQYSVAPSSTANISVTSNRKDSFMSEASLTSTIRLQDKTQTISSYENKSSSTLSGLSRPVNKEVVNNNKQEVQATVQELNRPTPFGALVGNSTSGRQTDYFGGFSIEQAKSEAPAFYYPQLPEYSSVVGWNHHEPEGIQTSGFLPGSYHGFQSINQGNTGIGQPAAKNNEGNFQDPRKSFPPSGN